MQEEVNITSQQECVSPHNKRLSCVSPHKQVLIRLVFVCMFLSKVLESSQQELVLCKSSQASPHKTSIYGQEVPQCPGIDQYVKICLTIAGMFHQVLQSLGSVTIPQYICISRCQASFHKVASLWVHILELCQPSPSTVSTNPKDHVSTNLERKFNRKACDLSRVSFFFIFNWKTYIN